MTARRVILAMLSLWLVCGGSLAFAETPRVFAAASLTDALNEAGKSFAAAGHERPVFSFAASSTLARQLEQGARADIFISADEEWMDYLQKRALIDGASRIRLLTNRLVLIAPADRPLRLSIRRGFPLLQALSGGRLAMADPDSVPAGRYGRAALTHLGVWSQVEQSVARAENVRAALRFVETGEAAAGIVYATDAKAVGARVQLVGVFPASSHPAISYPLAITAESRNVEARAFAQFLQSPKGDAIFRRHGFGVR